MNREHQVLEFLQTRGLVTVKRVSKSLGLSKALVRGVLWHSDHTQLVYRAPACRRKKPVWSYSETRERPDAHKVSHLILRSTLEEHEDEDH
jgi:hypothetical protein